MKSQYKLSDNEILNILRQQINNIRLTETEVKLNTDIVDVRFLGIEPEIIQIDGYDRKIDRYIFLIEKEMDNPNSNNKERIIIKEYYKDTELLAVDDGKYSKKFGLIPSEKYVNKAEIEDLQIIIANNTNKSLSDLEKKEIKKIAKLLNKKPEELHCISEIDTNALITSMNGKTELNLNEKITETETFADIVPDVKKYKKVIVDYSERIKGGSGKFSFIGIDERGSKEVINSLIPTQGINPTNDIVTINHNGDTVQEEQPSSIYSVKGRPDEGFMFKLDQYGIPNVSYVRGMKSKVYLAGQVKTSNIKPTTLEVRKMMDKTKNTSVIDEVGKAKKEVKATNQHTNINNIDDNPNNDIEI